MKYDITKAIIGRSQTMMSTIYTQMRGLAFDLRVENQTEIEIERKTRSSHLTIVN